MKPVTRRAKRRNWWCPKRKFFQVRQTWSHAADPQSGRPVGGHHVLVYCADGKGRIVMSPDLRNPKSMLRPPHYGWSKRVSQLEQEKWEWMCNTLRIVWWAYLPHPPPIKTMPDKRALFHDSELPMHTEWFNLTTQTHEGACYCTACKQWFPEVPSSHQCGKIRNAGPLCITTTPYA